MINGVLRGLCSGLKNRGKPRLSPLLDCVSFSSTLAFSRLADGLLPPALELKISNRCSLT